MVPKWASKRKNGPDLVLMTPQQELNIKSFYGHWSKSRNKICSNLRYNSQPCISNVIINHLWRQKCCYTHPRGVLGSSFAGYVPLASQNPYPIIVYSVSNYRPHLSHFWANVTVISETEFNVSRLLNIKTTAGTIFQLWIFLFLNPCLPEFSYPKNLQPHSSNSTKNTTPL